MFTWIDWVITAVVIISSLISLKHGFFSEVLSLLSWTAAAVGTWTYNGMLADQLSNYIETPLARNTIASILLFIGILLVGAIINYAVCKLIKTIGVAGINRSLGMVFGAMRGCIIIAAALSLTTLVPLEQDSAWKNSVLLPHFLALTNWLKEIASTTIIPLLKHLHSTYAI